MRHLLFTLLLLFSISAFSQNSTISFINDTTLDAALSIAKQKHKKLLLCFDLNEKNKKHSLKLDVFSQKEVGEYYNEHFVCMSVYIQSKSNKEICKQFNVKGTPDFIYLNENGEIIHRAIGQLMGGFSWFIDLGKVALDSTKNLKAYQDKIANGDLTPATLFQYFRLTISMENPRKLLDQYYNRISDEQKYSIDTWNLFRSWDNNIESPMFDFYINNRQKTEDKIGKKEVEQMIVEMMDKCQSDTAKYYWFKEIAPEIFKRNKESNDFYNAMAYYEYQKADKNSWKDFLLKAQIYFVNSDIPADEYHSASLFVYSNYMKYKDKKALKFALGWAGLCIKASPENSKYADCYAHILYDLHKEKEAILYEEMAVKNGTKSDDYDSYQKELERFRKRK
ncbi:MAG: hypothetical protein Q8909_04820 [Bacteroidota bacterium]|nr:hypothetical protein [Bacteroidota bacterium]